MKVKKQKRHRKILTFYTACFGFRKPYKVLCDGTFVHHLLVNRITPADTAIGNVLSATIKLYTTRCVLAELKRLGSSYSEALEAAHKLIVARCEHEKCKSADACIMEVVGEKNSEHFFVASQDTDLRKQLQEVPGVPLIFGLRNALFLESPSAFQREYVKTSEEGRLHMTQKEYQIFKDRVMNRLTGEEANNSITEIMEIEDSEDQTINVQAVEKGITSRNRMEIKDEPQFKRKRAKGPNPLSCKKKKSEKQNIGPLKETNEDNTVKRSRKRKRSHKQKMATETSS
ncbi:rRNA-processing protein UTP23 [Glycine max]|nr:rRNA-processing protein UTP23 [Glycine max]